MDGTVKEVVMLERFAFVALLLAIAGLLWGQPAGLPAAQGETSPLSLTGILAIIASVFAGLTSLLVLWRSGRVKAVVEETKAINMAQSGELKEVKILVDGRYGEVLQELADVKKLLAESTGRKADKDRADSAQARADGQAERVKEAKASKEEA